MSVHSLVAFTTSVDLHIYSIVLYDSHGRAAIPSIFFRLRADHYLN